MTGEEFINKYKPYFSYDKDLQTFLQDVHSLCDKCYDDGLSNGYIAKKAVIFTKVSHEELESKRNHNIEQIL